MSNRFGRDTTRNSLFSTYDSRSTSPSKLKNPSNRPSRPTSGYGFNSSSSTPSHTPSSNAYNNSAPAFSAYPGSSHSPYAGESGSGGGGFRTATPNSRGQYSAAVLDELESQNDAEVGMLSSKVRDLKHLTNLIGTEIRDSSALADKMNEQFEGSRQKLRGTMKRMLRMAEKTGVGWRVWLGFFAVVCLLFWYVWLF
ncbi:hypothetical protein BU24DRAFT_492658 [Aaosphaeria arxii CBS 175.79]|uniref:t-SNARE coiled-coil homology domain-containing protein n=1 Tax=Aaosphaeria arxii CBS 175.79 TaxID=1450172 RepID=A0A6A5XUJ3_9PLEO|nr:uncharacterized protein BU24DRAFT_492658 [Aaosphaeria arxii CBS 175.79]KAF2016596.1 hypothetical protein BU24DRAFT_492658 [Aaosphaeria arxii CBS 175.79]